MSLHILIFLSMKRLERGRGAHGSASNNSVASFLHFPCLLPLCVPNKTCSHVFASFSFSFCHYWLFFFTFFMSARSQFYVANKTCSPTFAASRQNSDLGSGIEPHNAVALPRRDHPHLNHLAHVQHDDEQDEDNECVYKLSFTTFNC